jgi:hypothetical protein
MSSNDLDTQQIVIGVFGKREKIDIAYMFDYILTPLLHHLQCIPNQILVPTEGKTSLIIQEWAESLSIRCIPVMADWMRNGKLASVMRDKYILQECTHALIIDGLKTERYKKLSQQILRKGKQVFFISGQLNDNQCSDIIAPIEYLIPDEKIFNRPKPSVKNRHETKCLVQICETKGRDHTSNSKTGPLLRLWQSSKVS